MSENSLNRKLKFNFKYLIASIFALALFGSIVFGLYNQFNSNSNNIAKAASDPVITLGLTQKSGTAPFDAGTCIATGTSYTPGQDVCDTDNVVRTLDTVEFSWTVSVTSDPANNVTVVQTLPSSMTFAGVVYDGNRNSQAALNLPAFCKTGTGFNPQSNITDNVLTCNLGSFASGTSTTTVYDKIFAKVKGDNPNATTINLPAITANADSNTNLGQKTANVTSDPLPNLIVSASPRYDLVIGAESLSVIASKTNPQGDPGLVVGGLTSIKLQGRGVEMPQQPFNFNLQLDIQAPIASGQTYSGARLYDWDPTLPACVGAINTPGFGNNYLTNINCVQTAQGEQVTLSVNGFDMSGTVARDGGAPSIDVFSQKVRFWIPKTDFDKINGSIFSYRLVGSNFAPISIAAGTNNGTGIESNLSNNTSGTPAIGYNPANPASGIFNRTSFEGPSGDQRISAGFQVYTLGELGRLDIALGNSRLFETENDLDFCTAIDPAIGRITAAPNLPIDPNNIFADFANATIEYANIAGFPATTCNDADGTWVSAANISAIGGFENVTRFRIKNLDRLNPFIQTSFNIPFKINNSVPNLEVLVSPYQSIIRSSSLTSGNWILNGQNTQKSFVKTIPRTSITITPDGTNNNLTTALLNNPAGANNTVQYSLLYGTFSGLSSSAETTIVNYTLKLPVGQKYLIGSSKVGTTSFEPTSIIDNSDGTQDVLWSISNLPLNTPTTSSIIFKTVVSAFAPTGRILTNTLTTLSPDYFNSTASPACGSGCGLPQASITVQNLSSFAVEQVPNNPLIEKNQGLGFTLRYGNLNTTAVVNSSQHINVFPFNNQSPARNPATNFTGNLDFTGLVLAPNSASTDPGVVNTNDNITGVAGAGVQYTRSSSSSISSDPCDPSNNPAGQPVNTNPQCTNVNSSVTGTGTTIWCDATPASGTKNYTLLGVTGTTGADSTTCPSALSQVTAFRLTTGSLPIASASGGTIYEVRANFLSSNNSNNNIYNNLSQARANTLNIVATSNSAVTRVSSGSISGNIFSDKNSDGLKTDLGTIPNPNFDPGIAIDPVTNPETITNPNNEGGISGVTVELRNGAGNLDDIGNPITPGSLVTTTTATTTTDNLGNYTFSNIPSGNYTINVTQPNLSTPTFDTDGIISPSENVIAVALNFVNGVGVENVNDANFGYKLFSRITGNLYLDNNNNGIKDMGEDINGTSRTLPTGITVNINSIANPNVSGSTNPNLNFSSSNPAPENNIAIDVNNGNYTRDLPVGFYEVSITNTNVRYSISTSTELGVGTGSNPTRIETTTGNSVSAGNDGLYLIQILNTDIATIICTPTTQLINELVNCEITLTAGKDFANLTGTIKLKISDGSEITCPAFPASGNNLTCNDVNVGTLIGTFKPSFNASGSGSSFLDTGSSDVVVVSPVTISDIPSLIVTCIQAPANSTTTCTFPLPSNKTLPTDFKLSIGNGNINQLNCNDTTTPNTPGCNSSNTASSQSCTIGNTPVTNTVTCTNIPTGNSIGNIPIFGNLGTGSTATKTPTGENVIITGSNFGNIDWIFNPTQGGSSPLFRSNDNTTIRVNNFRTIFDTTPSNNTRYTCRLEYANLGDRLSSNPGWNPLSPDPIAYITGNGANAGCNFNLSKLQRANVLNHKLRLTITDTQSVDFPICNPGDPCPLGGPNTTYIFYNEYFYRFEGAGFASGG